MSSLKYRLDWHDNIANFVTVTRICLAVFIVCLMLDNPDQIYLIFVLFCLASLTDSVGGYLARKMNIKSDLGGFLDRLADKVLIIPMLIFIGWSGYSIAEFKTQTQAIIVVLIILEGVLTLSAFWGNKRGKKISSNIFGKIKMTLQCVLSVFWLYANLFYRQLGVDIFMITDLLLLAACCFAALSCYGYYKEFNRIKSGSDPTNSGNSKNVILFSVTRTSH